MVEGTEGHQDSEGNMGKKNHQHIVFLLEMLTSEGNAFIHKIEDLPMDMPGITEK